jgi:hypothetical protein
MQAIAGQVKSLLGGGGVKDCKDSFGLVQEVGTYPASVAPLIETLEAAMLEAPDHTEAV